MDSKPTLGYWKIRHLASGIRYQLAYCGVNYNMVEYTMGQAPEFNRDEWLTQKEKLGLDFPNLPYFIDGDFSLTETLPIHKYITDKWRPELQGKDPQTRATISMLSAIIYDLKFKQAVSYYTQGKTLDG